MGLPPVLARFGHSVLATALLCISGLFLAETAIAQTPLASDFNGDGFDDLAIAIPGFDVDGKESAGAIAIVPGGTFGIDGAAATLLWHRGTEGIPGEPAAGEGWGSVLEIADFDGDGYADLAVGSSRALVNGVAGAGDVVVFFGSLDGLRSFGAIHLTPAAELDAAQFGTALATGRFNGDPFLDLAVGAPGAFENAGAVIVFEASLAGGLVERAILQASDMAIADPQRRGTVTAFGTALAAGRFVDSTADGLVVASQIRDRGEAGTTQSGRLYVAAGSTSPAARITLSGEFFDIDLDLAPELVANSSLLATQLIAADFDADGYDDLAIGIPTATFPGSGDPIIRGGALVSLPGGADGFHLDRVALWHQDIRRFHDDIDVNDEFASALAVADFNADGFADLVVGVPLEDEPSRPDRGLFHLMAGGEGGLSIERVQTYFQDLELLTVQWQAGQAGDLFAASLGVGNFNGDSFPDLAIGVPGDPGPDGEANAGAVIVINGTNRGPTTVKSKLVSLANMPGLNAASSENDYLGLSVGGGAADCWFATLCQRFY